MIRGKPDYQLGGSGENRTTNLYNKKKVSRNWTSKPDDEDRNWFRFLCEAGSPSEFRTHLTHKEDVNS